MRRIEFGVLREAEGKEGGGGGAPVFDPAKFEAGLMGKVSELVAKTLTDTLTAREAVATKAAADKEAADKLKAEEDAANKGGEGKKSPETAKLEREVNTLKAEREAEKKNNAEKEKAAAEKAAKVEARVRDADIRGELSAYDLAKHGAVGVNQVLAMIGGNITRAEDDTLVGPDGLELKAYLAKFFEENDNLLAGSGSSGSGAQGARPGATPATRVDLDDIKAGMSPEKRAAALAQIQRFTGNR